MRFGGFLLQNGVVSKGDIVIALERQRLGQHPIGRIAIRHKMLTIKQVFNILQFQADRIFETKDDQKDVLFGDIAMELGYLDGDQLLTLLKIQMESRPTLGDTLVEMGILSIERLTEELRAFSDGVLVENV